MGYKYYSKIYCGNLRINIITNYDNYHKLKRIISKRFIETDLETFRNVVKIRMLNLGKIYSLKKEYYS